MSDSQCKGFNTLVLSTDKSIKDVHGAMNTPVYRTAAYEFPTSQAIADAFQNKEKVPSHMYSRVSNPTVESLEKKIKAISKSENVMMFSSGMAAISSTFMTLAYSGCNIVTSPYLFGNTFSFFQFTLAEFGVEIRFVDTNDLNAIESAIDENTCAFFCELITNPHLEIADLANISPILKKHHIPMVIDTTLIPWCGFNAKAFGVDIEVVSTTKYISGGATSLGGAIVDYGTFDWSKHPRLKKVTPQTPLSAFMFKIKREIARNLGASMDSDTAYLQSLGLETLTLRYEKMCNTTYQLAQFLETLSTVDKVSYTKLDSSPFKKLSDAMFTGNPGAMLTFNLKDQAACFAFMDKLQLIKRATNLFDNRSLIIHPASTIYGAFTQEMRDVMGIEDTLIRFSVGLEDLADLQADIMQALK